MISSFPLCLPKRRCSSFLAHPAQTNDTASSTRDTYRQRGRSSSAKSLDGSIDTSEPSIRPRGSAALALLRARALAAAAGLALRHLVGTCKRRADTRYAYGRAQARRLQSHLPSPVFRTHDGG